jgi:hypothetical protein
MVFSFCQSLPSYFYFILFFRTQCFGGVVHWTKSKKKKKKKKTKSLIIFPLPKLKKHHLFGPLSVMIHIQLAGIWGCLLKSNFFFWVALSLFDWPVTTQKRKEKKFKNVTTLLYIEIFTGNIQKFTILAHLYW